MKTNQGGITLAERASDYGRLRSVLLDWGYRENEIQRFLGELRSNQNLDERRRTTTDQSSSIQPRVS